MARSSSLASLSFLVFALAAAGGAAGCGQAPPAGGPAVTFDPCTPLALIPDATASPAQRAGVGASATLWNASAGSELAMTAASTADGGAPLVLPIHFQVAAAPFHGLYDAPNGQVFINDDLSGEELAITIAHEVGHAFGLVHVSPDVRPSLMNPGNLTVVPTPQDVATLADLWGRCSSLDAAGTE